LPSKSPLSGTVHGRPDRLVLSRIAWLTIEHIAVLAGVGRTTVQTAIGQAAGLGI
jgi:hypothetical protein